MYTNGSNSFLFVNATTMYQFKAKDSEIKYYTLCLGGFSKDFTINNMKKTRLNGIEKLFSVDIDLVDTNDTLDTHKYLMKGMKGIWHKINVWVH